jgi:hypothetical protein
MIAALNISLLSEATFGIIASFSHAMTQVSFLPLKFAGAGHPKPFSPSLMGLHLVSCHITSFLMEQES